MFRNKSAQVHQFSMVPRADIPRSKFRIQHTHKTTFDSGLLIPIYLDEILPGDKMSLKMTCFARLATPIFPIMDNMYIESFFFFVPNRLVWVNWQRFMGEQDNPTDSISFIIPQMSSSVGGYAVGSIYDYMGLPTAGQILPGNSYQHSSMFLRAYNLIYNEWFRDENLVDSVLEPETNGPDLVSNYTLLRRGKRPDYFTSCLPWPQKGNTAVTLPLTGNAQIKANTGTPLNSTITAPAFGAQIYAASIGTLGTLYADLSTVTATTINALRQSFQIQKLLERDARGGTRYTEILRAHFGVVSPDARLQRPEYLGGGSSPVNINPIAQTGPTGTTGSTTPIGTISAMGTTLAQGHGFSQAFTEHGMVIGLISVRADLTYQQGLRKMWSRRTRYDFYFPAFAHLGEQAVLLKEIYSQGTLPADDLVFGYQERWAEYRHNPNKITGLFRSTSVGTIDAWHLAQRFTAAPTLNATFINDTPPLSRVLAVGAAANGQQFICDTLFDVVAARPLPMYSVPGLIDHF